MDQVPKKPNGLRRRGNVWEYRKVVPDDVRSIIGKKEIIRSLQTSDYRTALRKYRIQMLDAESQIDAARRQIEAASSAKTLVTSLTTEEIQSIVLLWFHELESGSAPDVEYHLGDTEAEDAVEDAVKGNLAALGEPLDGERWVSAEVDSLLAKNNITLEKDSPDYLRIAALVKRGLFESNIRRLNQVTRQAHKADPYFRDVEYLSPVPDAVKRNQPKAKLTVKAVLEKYLAEKNVSQRTRSQYEQHIDRFAEYVGEQTPIEHIDREQIVGYRDLLRKIPPNASKLFPGMTFQQVADSPKAAKCNPLHPRSINKVLETLSTLFRFAEDWGYISRNPAKGLQLAVDEQEDPNRRRPYTMEELQSIFDAPLYRGCINDEMGFSRPGSNIVRRHRFWIPLIALYSGMRLNEICQLYTEDIKEEDGIAFIEIRERREDGSIAPDKSLKNKAARRKVPIHPELERIGFMAYVADIRQQQEMRLFPDLAYSNGGYSDAFQKWYSRFLGTVGLRDDKRGGGLVFHSFRHTFRDRLREAEVYAEYANRICGWTESGSTGKDYGDGTSVAKLYEQMAKVSYPKLDLSHLHTS